MARLALSVILLLVCLPDAAAAQQLPTMSPGTRVRIWTAPDVVPLTGKVVQQTANSLTVSPEGAEALALVDRSAITRLDVGHRRSRGKNALYGALICGALGALVGAAGASENSFLWNDRTEGALFFGMVSAPLGALFGLASKPGPERWSTSYVRPATRPVMSSAQLRFTLRF
jgi:hypothetical protein